MSNQPNGTSRRRDAQQQYQQLVASIDGIVWEADARTFQFTFVSQQAERLLGYPLDEWFTPGFWAEHIHPEDRAWAVEFCLRATREKRKHDFEYRMLAADGRTVWLRDIVSVAVEGGEAATLRGIMVDVTEQKRTEQALVESEELYRLLTESANDLIYLLDLEGRILYASPSVGRLLGRVPLHKFEVVHPDDVAAGQACWERILAGKSELLTVRVADAGGAWRWLEAWSSLIRYHDQPRVLSVCRDVSERKEAEDRFRRTAEELQRVMSSVSDYLWSGEVDEQGRWAYHYYSPVVERITGRPPSYYLQGPERWLEMIHADDRGRLQAAFQRVVSGQSEREEAEYRVVRPDGEIRWVRDCATVTRLGRRLRIDGVVSDVTERKRAEQALRRSEAYLAEAQRLGRTGSWAWDVATREFVHWSQEHYRLHGLDPQGGTPSWEAMQQFIHPEDRARCLAQIERAVRERTDCEMEYRAVLTDGTMKYIHSIAHPVFNAAGELVEFVGTEMDITERKRAEQALVESHGLLNAVVEGTADAVFVKDLRGRYLMINSAGARFIGRPVAEVLGKDDRELFSPETARRLMECDLQVMATGGAQMFEETATPAAGVTRTYLSNKSALRDAHGKVIGLIGIARDVTELKRLEEQLRQSQKMEAIGRLAGGVAHDFNNLLTVINGYSELVFSSLGADDPNRELVAEVQRAGDRAANLTRQLLAFSRRQVLQPEVLSLNTLLEDLLKLLKRLIGEDVELSLVPGAGLGLAKVDRGQFEQAVINLAVNARDAMPLGGRLIIETQNAEVDEATAQTHADVRPGRYVLMTVRDTGHGMDEATRARVFEPFFTTKEVGKGTGLGLAMVYGFVKQSGGHVEVESEVGRGTAFKVYLPRAEAAGPSARSSPNVLEAPRGSETVLLVEDEDSVRTLSRLVLQSSGYTVLEARDGQEGLRVAQQHPGPIHVLVTDLVMPRMSGRQLADVVSQARPGVRVLFLSGYTDEAMAQHGALEAGLAFLQKPFSPISLVRKVREVLDAEGGPR